ncbi:RICIN domain-containing protein [Actinoallomurus sp. NPDC052308]|uniref:RICIN domain-containing protein n=1 Tax=Actinoallomurus sp. NPDC052308 TaxID=3155530 RepID=UPI00343F21B0
MSGHHIKARVLTVVALGAAMAGSAVGPAWAEPGSKASPRAVHALSGPTNFVNSATGLCMTVHGASRAKGAKVDLYRCVGATNQKWTILSTTGVLYELVNQHSGMCLDVLGGSKKNGARLGQWPCNGKTNQSFQLYGAAGKRDFYLLAPRGNKYVQPKYHDRRSNNPVHQWGSKGTWAKWHH